MTTRALAALLALSAAAAAVQTGPGPADEAARPSLQQPLDAWRAERGASWTVRVDGETGWAEMIYGGGHAAPWTPSDDADWFALGRRSVEDAAALHGIDPLTLAEEQVVPIALSHLGTTDKVAVRFTQSLDGVPVEGGAVNVLLDFEGTLLSIQTTALPGLDELGVTPAIDDAQAVRAAAARFRSETGLTANRVLEPELVIVADETSETYRPTLAWKVGMQWLSTTSNPEGWTYYLDATSRAVVRREANVHFFDVSGTVSTFSTPGVAPDTGGNPATQNPAPYVTLTSDQGTVTTDASGSFNFAGVSSVTNVQVRYQGPWVDVNNQAGSDYVLSAGTLSGSGNALVMNPSPSALTTAQANAHLGIGVFRDWVRAVNPADGMMDFQAPANPNISSTCNAYFDGVSTNYYQAGGGCVNTSYSTVVSHEQGHWANVLYNTGNGSDGMGEGNADVWAMYQYDSPLIGQDFCGTGCEVRDGNNTRQYCGDGNGGCYGGVHTDGEVWMGAAWKIRRNLKTSLGTVLGGQTADALFLGWMNAYDQTTIDSIMEIQWLTLDDDNALIADGTPHYAEIDGAFREQGFPGFDLSLIALESVTELGNTSAPGPYVVDATAIALVAPPLTAVRLFFSVDGGAPTQLVMSNVGGDVYRASIPDLGSPRTIRYYVQATDSASNTVTFPGNAPAEAITFLVGDLTPIFADNFTSDLGWAVSNTSVSTGAWERVNPEGTTAQPENDNPTGGGTHCYITGGDAGSSVGSNDLDGGPTRLTSPAFDLSGSDGVVSYAYWHYNDDNDDSLVVEVSNDGGSTWATAASYLGGAGGWAETSFIVSDHVTPTANVVVRFSTSDNPNDSITESAIDDVVVQVLTDSGGVGTASCFGIGCPCANDDPSAGCANSSGGGALLAGSGSASVATDDLTLTATGTSINSQGLVYMGDTVVSAAFFDGLQCALGNTFRFLDSIASSGPSGQFSYTGPVAGSGGLITPGSTWHFQYWFRDTGGPCGTGANLTNMLSVTYTP